MGIKATDIQQLALRFCERQPNIFLNPGVGMGKTTLLCVLAIAKAVLTKEALIVLNSDSRLLYRDYKKV